MAKVYFGFAVADGMFPADCEVTRKALSLDDVKVLLAVKAEDKLSLHSATQGRVANLGNNRFVAIEGEVISCCNSSHEATVVALKQRFGLDVAMPATPPQINLQSGDSIIVMSVRGLKRLTESRHYSEEEVKAASFVFGLWTVR